jgi:hypothetical protein
VQAPIVATYKNRLTEKTTKLGAATKTNKNTEKPINTGILTNIPPVVVWYRCTKCIMLDIQSHGRMR